MNYLKKTRYTLFFILIQITTNQAQRCHRFPSRVNPEILCNGFTNLLHIKELPDRTINNLSFSKNNITEINVSSFEENLSAITNLYMDNNVITRIGANAFKNLPNLQVIDLSNNKLEVLDSETFSFNKDLTTIDLTGNKIKILNVNAIYKLAELKKLILSDNPLDVCNTETAKTLWYLTAKKIDTYFLSSCENQTNYREINVLTTTSTCVDNTPNTQNKTIAKFIDENYILLMIVLLVMIGLAVGLGYFIAILFIKLINKVKGIGDNLLPQTELGNCLLSTDKLISGDENGYEIPRKPENPHQYLTILPDPKDAPLILLNSEDDLRRSIIQVPVHTSMTSGNNSSNTYQPVNHVYEEIMEKNNYVRNMQQHLLQPYSCVKIVPGTK